MAAEASDVLIHWWFSFQILLAWSGNSVVALWNSPVRFEFSSCLNDFFKPFLIMKVFVFSLALNRMGSHNSKSAIAPSPTLRPNRFSTGVMPLVFEKL